jgi:hypothetical protein
MQVNILYIKNPLPKLTTNELNWQGVSKTKMKQTSGKYKRIN